MLLAVGGRQILKSGLGTENWGLEGGGRVSRKGPGTGGGEVGVTESPYRGPWGLDPNRETNPASKVLHDPGSRLGRVPSQLG